MGRTVIRHRDGIGSHLHLAFLHRQGSRGGGEAVVLGYQSIHNRGDGILADIGELVAVAKIGHIVQSGRDCALVLAMLVTADRIGEDVGIAVRTDLVLGFHRQHGWCHYQFAVNGVYVIVGRLCAGVQRIIELVGVSAHIRSGTSGEILVSIACALFPGKTVTRHCDTLAGDVRAVVRAGKRTGGQDYRTLGHGNHTRVTFQVRVHGVVVKGMYLVSEAVLHRTHIGESIGSRANWNHFQSITGGESETMGIACQRVHTDTLVVHLVALGGERSSLVYVALGH